ncbi:unnamed protein product [Lampetra fluviatilis]
MPGAQRRVVRPGPARHLPPTGTCSLQRPSEMHPESGELTLLISPEMEFRDASCQARPAMMDRPVSGGLARAEKAALCLFTFPFGPAAPGRCAKS